MSFICESGPWGFVNQFLNDVNLKCSFIPITLISCVSEKQHPPESWNKKMQNIRHSDRPLHMINVQHAKCNQCDQHYLGVINTLLQGAQAWHFLQVCRGIEYLQQKLKAFFSISWYNLQFKHLLHKQLKNHSWKYLQVTESLMIVNTLM